MRLNEMQRFFRDIMLDHPDALKAPPENFAGLFESSEIPLEERLKVYRGNIVGGLTEKMLSVFPVLDKLVGTEFLRGMACSFVLAHPPARGCLNLYGAGFDTFIRNFPPARSLSYLPDVAAFEIALNMAYHASDEEVFTLQDLALIPSWALGDALWDLRSSAALVRSTFPLRAIRDYCLNEVKNKPETLNLNQGGVRLMVYRPALEVLIVDLAEAEYELLNHLAQRLSLGEAVQKVLQEHGDFDLSAFLKRHMMLGTFKKETYRDEICS
ncbi:MAG: DNA-binding domain-containing protein [Alphaproteobacteria bacterium]|nr:DNA-binding domain-containing protein [Alphaproteobacteria bacterium]